MLRNYLLLATRVLLRRKFFTAVSLFGIAFTLLVLTVAAALFDHVLAARPPETRLGRTLGVYYQKLTGPHSGRTGFPSYVFLDRTVRTLPGVEAVSVFSLQRPVVSYLQGAAVRSYVKRTDGAYWRILDFEFLEGGPFTAEDERAGNRVAVINETTRRRFFGGEPAVGRPLELDGQRFRVVGVVPDVPFVRLVPFADVWVPLSTAKSGAYRHDWDGGYMAMVLAASRADFPAIRGELAARLPGVDLPPGDFDRIYAGADTLFEFMARTLFDSVDPRAPAARLRLLLGLLAVLFMLLPAVNLVNLNLSRILERAGEIGVRKAFGASKRALVGQFLVENVVLTLLGGLLGFLLSGLVLAALNESGVIPYAELRLNHRVFAWGLALAVFFGLLSGGYPAWRMSRLHPVEALSGRSR